MLDDPPEWLQDWSTQVGAKLEDGLREAPGYIAFARENGTDLPHLHRDGAGPVRRPVSLASCSQRTPKGAAGRAPSIRRKDEYPEAAR